MTSPDNTAAADNDRPLGKDYRAWLRDHTPDEVPPAPLRQMIKLGVTEKPYDNRTGTWPDIVTTWLPYFVEQKDYASTYLLIDAAFRHTNATVDQKKWADRLLSCSVNVRRVVFRSALPLLLESMRNAPRGGGLLVKNMMGLFGEPSWIDPAWFQRWSPDKTMTVMTSTGAMSSVSGAMLQLWWKPLKERDDRMAEWHAVLQHQELRSVQESMLELLPSSWRDNIYDVNVGRAYVKSLSDGDLNVVVNYCNSNLTYKDHAPACWDVLRELVRRRHYEWDMKKILFKDDGEKTALGTALDSMTRDWKRLSKDKRFEDDERRSFVALLAYAGIAPSETLSEIAAIENVDAHMLELHKMLDLKTWPACMAMYHEKAPALTEEMPNLGM